MIYYTENRSSLSVSACQTCQDMKQRQLHGAIVVFENDDLIDFPLGRSKEKMEIKEGKKERVLDKPQCSIQRRWRIHVFTC